MLSLYIWTLLVAKLIFMNITITSSLCKSISLASLGHRIIIRVVRWWCWLHSWGRRFKPRQSRKRLCNVQIRTCHVNVIVWVTIAPSAQSSYPSWENFLSQNWCQLDIRIDRFWCANLNCHWMIRTCIDKNLMAVAEKRCR